MTLKEKFLEVKSYEEFELRRKEFKELMPDKDVIEHASKTFHKASGAKESYMRLPDKKEKIHLLETHWDRFRAGIMAFVENYYREYVPTDYEIRLDMNIGEVIRALEDAESVSDLPKQLQKVAEQYKEYLIKN